MAGELGKKLLPEGSDTLAGLGAQDRGIQFRKVLVVCLGPNDGGRDETRVLFPEGNVASAKARVYTIEDDDVMGVDGVAVAEARVLLHARGVPNVELNSAVVRLESNGEDLCTDGGDVLYLKVVPYVAMEKRGLTHATIAHEDNFIDRGSHSLL